MSPQYPPLRPENTFSGPETHFLALVKKKVTPSQGSTKLSPERVFLLKTQLPILHCLGVAFGTTNGGLQTTICFYGL